RRRRAGPGGAGTHEQARGAQRLAALRRTAPLHQAVPYLETVCSLASRRTWLPAGLRAERPLQGAADEHACEMPTVVGACGDVARRIGSLVGPLGRGPRIGARGERLLDRPR